MAQLAHFSFPYFSQFRILNSDTESVRLTLFGLRLRFAFFFGLSQKLNDR